MASRWYLSKIPPLSKVCFLPNELICSRSKATKRLNQIVLDSTDECQADEDDEWFTNRQLRRRLLQSERRFLLVLVWRVFTNEILDICEDCQTNNDESAQFALTGGCERACGCVVMICGKTAGNGVGRVNLEGFR